jgi:hypothetical protein
MFTSIDWGQLFITLLGVAVLAGIAKQKIDDLNARVKTLENDHDLLTKNHQKIELTVVNVPTKDDFKVLSGEIQQLKLSLQKLDLTLDFMARQQGFPNGFQPKSHSET